MPKSLLPLLIVTIVGLAFIAAADSAQAQSPTVDLMINDPAAFQGYTLYSPIRTEITYILDMHGRPVHSWEHEFPPGNGVYFLDNGHLLLPLRPTNGGGGLVREYDWEGNLLWEFEYFDENVRQHHDIEPMPNGNVLILAWDFLSMEEAIANGRDTALLEDSALWPDHVIEVRPIYPDSAEIVWEWHAWDHLIQDYDSTKPNYGVVADHPELIDLNYNLRPIADWHHANAVDYSPELDQIAISLRSFSEFWVIDHSTTTAEAASHSGGNSGMGGDILYRWGNPQTYDAGTVDDQALFYQHDIQWIEPGLPGEGNMLVFNNGGQERFYSSVDEIVTPVDINGHYPLPAPGTPHGPEDLAWTYFSDPTNDFYASFISGAHRLPNGNTMICAGPMGRLFEVTVDGQIVWEFVNPMMTSGPVFQGDDPGPIAVFRCTRLADDHPGLADKVLTPSPRLSAAPLAMSFIDVIPEYPGEGDSIHFTCLVSADSGIAGVELWADIGTGYVSYPMFDDGAHHDGTAGDGWYGASLAPQTEGTQVSYYLKGVDTQAREAFEPPNPPLTVYSLAVGPESAPIFINEVVAFSLTCCPDGFEVSESFVELYNDEEAGISLDDYYISTDSTNPTQVSLSGLAVPAGGWTVLWADSQPGQGSDHLDLVLDSAGGMLALYFDDGRGVELIDLVVYPAVPSDYSYGRIPDGNDWWEKMATPTPGVANEGTICGDMNGSFESPDIADLVYFVQYMFSGGPEPLPGSADVNGSGGLPDIADLVYLVDFMFTGGPALICP